MIVAVSTNNNKKNTLIDSDALVTYLSSRPGHACPAINYFKVTFFVTLRIWIGHVLIWLLYVKFLVAGLSFNPLQQTTGNDISIKLWS